MNILLVSFADGSPEFKSAGLRLEKQARDFGIFSKILVLDSAMLSAINKSYSQAVESWKHLDAFPLYFRAAKSWVIKAALEGQFGTYDYVCYVDAGCEINVNQYSLTEFVNMLKFTDKHLAYAESIRLPEYEWTKPEAAKGIGVTEANLRNGQVQATWSMWKWHEANVRFAKEWCDLSAPELGFWQDPTLCSFCHRTHQHRRDQSIFSLLWKKYGYRSRSYKLDFSPDSKIGSWRLASLPILTLRTRGGDSQVSALARVGWLSYRIAKFVNDGNAYLKGFTFHVFQAFADLPKCFRPD